MRKLTPFFTGLLLLLSFTAFGAKDPSELIRKLSLTRELLTRPTVKEFLRETFEEELKPTPEQVSQGFKFPRSKDVSETQLMIMLDQNPELMDEIETYIKQVPKKKSSAANIEKLRQKWREKFTDIIANKKVEERFRNLNNPVEPYIVSEAEGYSNVKVYVNHARGNAAADDLKQVWIQEIRKAKKEIALNVFDFDLDEVAEELIKAQKSGISVKIGIDKSVIETRPEVEAIFKKLKSHGIFVHDVDSVGLNHQKMMAIDWSMEGQGKVVFSSGNLTQSCLGKEGDLVDVPLKMRPNYSVPNANHVITLDSNVISSIVEHEISKTIDPGLQLRGTEYPLSGAFKIWGGSKSLGKERPFMILAFSPSGAMDGINKNFISQAILRTKGPVKMAQFAFSSKTVEEALFARAKEEIAHGGSFKFQSVGDTPFAMQDWSVFLEMSGLKLQRSKNKETPPKYLEIPNSPWKKLLGEERLEELRKHIRTAPPEYGNHHVSVGGQNVEVSSKIHHKILITGDPSDSRLTVTGSFNFSAGAESNQEYILVTNDERISTELDSAVDELYKNSENSVFEEAIARNTRNNFEDVIESNVERAQIRRRKVSPPSCNDHFLPPAP